MIVKINLCKGFFKKNILVVKDTESVAGILVEDEASMPHPHRDWMGRQKSKRELRALVHLQLTPHSAVVKRRSPDKWQSFITEPINL